MIEVEIPIKLQSPNRSCHWTTKYRKNEKDKQALGLLLNLHKMPALPAVVTITSIRPRLFDQDNFIASAKSVRDCLANHLRPGLASGRADDNEQLIRWIYKQKIGESKEYKLKILIETENEWIERTNTEFFTRSVSSG